MTITAHNLMRRAYRAFRSGNVAEREKLKDAMAWINFQNSVAYRQAIAILFHRLDQHDLTGLPSKPARPKGEDEYCQGICTMGVSQFHWVDIVSKQTTTDLPRNTSPQNQALFRNRLIRWAENRINTKRGQILWLSKLDEAHFQHTQPLGLLGALGRYEQSLNPGDRVAIYTIEVESVYKPTMMDAGFAFYYLAWPDADSHGMTLSLSDGQPTHKEWVVPKDGVKVVNACFLMPGLGSLVEDQLPAAYWEACQQRVLDRRNFSGGTA